ATDYKERAVDAAMATAAAPTYFARHITANDVGLIDGGIWANNPAGIAVVEAIAILEWAPDDIRVLSIGCLDEIKETRRAYGVATLAFQLANLFMAGQSHGSLGCRQAPDRRRPAAPSHLPDLAAGSSRLL